MRLARVVGTVTGTVKDRSLTGHRMLIVDLVTTGGKVVEPEMVALDAVGAGEGDLVLVTTGSAARQAARLAGIPADLAAVVIVEDVVVGGRVADPSKKS
jgi:microcompartment protein CcmK/EutM